MHSPIPSVVEATRWIRQTVQVQFSLFVPTGNNRYKFGVTSKEHLLKLWNCKWPEKMNQLKVGIERPRSPPDCCALAVRYIPAELLNKFIFKEISESIKSAISFSKINYHRSPPTNDYRFCVTDANDYDEI